MDKAKTSRTQGQDKRENDDNDDTLEKKQDKTRTRPGQVLHIRCRTSEKQLIDFEDGSLLYTSLLQLPFRLAIAKQFGISMQRVFLKGQWRNPAYIENRIKDHERGIENNRAMGKKCVDTWNILTYELLRIVAKSRGFLTYDKLEQVLTARGYVWNQLVSMKNKEREDLAKYPQYTNEEEEKLALERDDLKKRKEAEQQHQKYYESLKEEEERLLFAINHLKDTVKNFEAQKKFADAHHYGQEIEKFEEQLARVQEKMVEWHRQ